MTNPTPKKTYYGETFLFIAVMLGMLTYLKADAMNWTAGLAAIGFVLWLRHHLATKKEDKTP